MYICIMGYIYVYVNVCIRLCANTNEFKRNTHLQFVGCLHLCNRYIYICIYIYIHRGLSIYVCTWKINTCMYVYTCIHMYTGWLRLVRLIKL